MKRMNMRQMKNNQFGTITAIKTEFYSPCFVAVVCIVKESGSWKWGLFSMGFNTVLAFTLAVLIFQIGSAFGYS